MTAALVQPGQRLTIEEAREALHQRDATLNEGRRALALDTYRLYLRWSMLYPKASMREYVTWLGMGEYTGRHYSYIYGGFALDRGFTDERFRLGDLHQIGQALMVDGSGEADVRARLAAGEPPRLSSKTTAPMSVPAPEREAMQEAVDRVSSLDKLPAPEAHARIFRAWEAAGPTLQSALLHAEATGENPLDALVRAVDDRKDYRSALASQGCLICSAQPVQLHHIKVNPDDRYRSNTVFAVLCERHHIARPGDAEDSIHAMTIETINARYPDFWQRVAVSLATAAEASRPEKEQV